jgi:hypothetical protein
MPFYGMADRCHATAFVCHENFSDTFVQVFRAIATNSIPSKHCDTSRQCLNAYGMSNDSDGTVL